MRRVTVGPARRGGADARVHLLAVEGGDVRVQVAGERDARSHLQSTRGGFHTAELAGYPGLVASAEFIDDIHMGLVHQEPEQFRQAWGRNATRAVVGLGLVRLLGEPLAGEGVIGEEARWTFDEGRRGAGLRAVAGRRLLSLERAIPVVLATALLDARETAQVVGLGDGEVGWRQERRPLVLTEAVARDPLQMLASLQGQGHRGPVVGVVTGAGVPADECGAHAVGYGSAIP